MTSQGFPTKKRPQKKFTASSSKPMGARTKVEISVVDEWKGDGKLQIDM